MPTPITWYSIDQRFATIDHPAISEDAAKDIVRGYFSRLKPHYETGEEAIAETMFGFKKSQKEFLEICINLPSGIDVKYEVTTPGKLLFFSDPKTFQRHADLRSEEEVLSCLSQFFQNDSEFLTNAFSQWKRVRSRF